MSCANCIPTPSFEAVFSAAVPGVCSGQCDFCLDCYDRAKYTRKGLVRCFGCTPNCPLAPPALSAFEIVMGVSLEDWMAADTTDALIELLHRRDTQTVPGGGPDA